MKRVTHEYASVDQFTELTRRAATKEAYSPVMIVLTILATVGVFAYGGFLLTPSHRGDWLPWLLVVGAETILVFHAVFSMWTVLAGMRSPRGFAYHAAKEKLYDPAQSIEADPSTWPVHLDGERVSVDVLITVYGEPVDVIRRTAEAAKRIRGAHRVWILDDGNSDQVQAMAGELEVNYVRRRSNSGAKAGNVNNALTVAKGDFFVILDADFVPLPGFIEETLPFFSDSTVAFVQTPQTYGNLHNFISRGAGYMQAMFYRFIQPGRNQFNAAFCVGTNVIFRRAAIDDIGGMNTDSKSEDVWTSLYLHERGWRSIYIPTTLAVGDAPDTIEAYSKQQLRWATGGFEILFTRNPLFNGRLTSDQRLMYFVTATHYLTGIVPGVLLFVPALEIFLDLRPVSMNVGPWTWLLFYAGFYVMQVVLAFFTLGSFRWEVLLLAAASFPIYIKAFMNVVSGRDQAWSVTGARKDQASPFNFIIPQVCALVFILATFAVGIWRDSINDMVSVATIWCGINSVVLFVFVIVAWDEGMRSRRHGDVDSAELAKTAAITALLASPEPLKTPDQVIRHQRESIDEPTTARRAVTSPTLATLDDAAEPERVVAAGRITS